MHKLKILQFADRFDVDIKGVRPFVVDANANLLSDAPVNSDNIINAPFEKFSLEMTGNKAILSIKMPDDENPLLSIAGVCEELSPGNYRFTMFNVDKSTPGVVIIHTVTKNRMSIELYAANKKGPPSHSTGQHVTGFYNHYLSFFKSAVGQMQVKHTGQVSTAQSIKVKTATKKRVKYSPRSYIYVSSVDRKKEVPTLANNTRVRWVKAWEVSAHWRRLKNPNSLGLNRAGDRVVKGYTFIREYAKGKDRNNALIKPRIFKGAC